MFWPLSHQAGWNERGCNFGNPSHKMGFLSIVVFGRGTEILKEQAPASFSFEHELIDQESGIH